MVEKDILKYERLKSLIILGGIDISLLDRGKRQVFFKEYEDGRLSEIELRNIITKVISRNSNGEETILNRITSLKLICQVERNEFSILKESYSHDKKLFLGDSVKVLGNKKSRVVKEVIVSHSVDKGFILDNSNLNFLVTTKEKVMGKVQS